MILNVQCCVEQAIITQQITQQPVQHSPRSSCRVVDRCRCAITDRRKVHRRLTQSSTGRIEGTPGNRKRFRRRVFEAKTDDRYSARQNQSNVLSPLCASVDMTSALRQRTFRCGGGGDRSLEFEMLTRVGRFHRSSQRRIANLQWCCRQMRRARSL